MIARTRQPTMWLVGKAVLALHDIQLSEHGGSSETWYLKKVSRCFQKVVHAYLRACVRACVHACVRACVRMRVIAFVCA